MELRNGLKECNISQFRRGGISKIGYISIAVGADITVGGIVVDPFAYIRLILEAKCGDDPLVRKGEQIWMSQGISNHVRKSCTPTDRRESTTLKNGRNSGNFTTLGKVIDLEVCGMLCCEVDDCDLALLEEDRHCFSVSCHSIESCELIPHPTSKVLTLKRKDGKDIWTIRQRTPQNLAAAHQPKIVVKQAAVQKSLIPETKKVDTVEQKGSLIAISNTDKVDSPMDALLRKETSMIKEKQNNNKKETVAKPNVANKIQDITEHYLKAEEKSDMTALQENETTTSHASKLQRRHRDLRHTLISPITIGAFTCMAVIAVSGFAMAIIKYQRERKEFEDKQTQKP